MANLLLDLVKLLTAQGLVQGDGIDTFRDTMPDSPNPTISLVEFGGTPIANAPLAVRNIQILVRTSSYLESRDRIYAIYNYLNKVYEPIFEDSITGRWFTGRPRQVPFKLREDNSARIIFAFNYTLTTFND